MSSASAFDHPLLRGLESASVHQLIGLTGLHAVNAGRLLHRPEMAAGSVHLVLSGFLRAFEVTADGREILLEIIGPGGFDGLLPARGFRGHFTEALTDAIVCSLDADELDSLLREPGIARRLIELIVERLRNREDQLRLFAIREPENRLAFLLLYLADKLGHASGTHVELDVRLTHQALADMLGIRRETVTHAFRRLTASGGLRITHGRILLDLNRLRLQPGQQPGWPSLAPPS